MESKVKDTCLNIQPLLYSYVDNELTPKEFDAVSTHLSECSKCKNAIANIYKIKDMVKVSYAQKEEVDFSKKIMAGIAFNNKYGKKEQLEVVKNKKYSKVTKISKIVAGKLIYLSALAAAILLVVGATYSGPLAQASVISVNFEK